MRPANARLSGGLPVLVRAVCRFARLPQVHRSRQSWFFKERSDMQVWLNIGSASSPTPTPARLGTGQRRDVHSPVRKWIRRRGGGECPVITTRKFFLRPHYQLEGLDAVSLRFGQLNCPRPKQRRERSFRISASITSFIQ